MSLWQYYFIITPTFPRLVHTAPCLSLVEHSGLLVCFYLSLCVPSLSFVCMYILYILSLNILIQICLLIRVKFQQVIFVIRNYTSKLVIEKNRHNKLTYENTEIGHVLYGVSKIF